jgi:hypothetical protein
MTESEVRQIVGEPMRVRDSSTNGIHTSDFGLILKKNESIPVDLTFSIRFSTNRVVGIEDPFGGIFSTNGLPPKPVPIIPRDGAQFDHNPRILDLRWYAASGWYPMQYELEVGADAENVGQPQTYSVGQPCAMVCVSAAGKGKWRVRAKNDLGVGPWSDYYYFDFRR